MLFAMTWFGPFDRVKGRISRCRTQFALCVYFYAPYPL